MKYEQDIIIFGPNDVDLNKSPLRNGLDAETYVLGAFNPGLERLPNGNLIMMVRVAEAIKNPIVDKKICSIRWDEGSYVLDWYDLANVITDDPRKFRIKDSCGNTIYGLTSLSWILPVELTKDGLEIVKIHYDKITSPSKSYQEYGVEDARLTKIGNKYYMTTCSVSSERHSTTIYSSNNGLDYYLEGIIFDHQNKDVLLFPEKISDYYYALTRPLGDHYFVEKSNSEYISGPSINIARSPDLIHWKPMDYPFIRQLRNEKFSKKVGGGAQPIKTEQGWLILFHAVESKGEVGIYRTFSAISNLNEPYKLLKMNKYEVMTENPELTDDLQDLKYVNDVVFTTGIVDNESSYIVASGESDLCCRITQLPKAEIKF